MNIDLHIEQLVFDGVAVAQHRLPELQAALEGELGQLLTSNGLAGHFQAPATFDRLDAVELKPYRFDYKISVKIQESAQLTKLVIPAHDF